MGGDKTKVSIKGVDDYVSINNNNGKVTRHGGSEEVKKLETIFDAVAKLGCNTKQIDTAEEKQLLSDLISIFTADGSADVSLEELQWVKDLKGDVKNYIKAKLAEIQAQQIKENKKTPTAKADEGPLEAEQTQPAQTEAPKQQKPVSEESAEQRRNRVLNESVAKLAKEVNKSDISETTNYTINKGDMLWNIAKTALQNQSKPNPPNYEILNMLATIVALNDIKDVNKINAGQTIKIPGNVPITGSGSGSSDSPVRTAANPDNVKSVAVAFDDIGITEIKVVKGNEKLADDFIKEYKDIIDKANSDWDSDEGDLKAKPLQKLYTNYAEAGDEEFACSVLASQFAKYAKEEDIINAINKYGAKFLDTLSEYILKAKDGLSVSNKVKQAIINRAVDIYKSANSDPANMVYLETIKKLAAQVIDLDDIEVNKVVTVPKTMNDIERLQKEFDDANALLVQFAKEPSKFAKTTGRNTHDSNNCFDWIKYAQNEKWIMLQKYKDGSTRVYVNCDNKHTYINKAKQSVDEAEVYYLVSADGKITGNGHPSKDDHDFGVPIGSGNIDETMIKNLVSRIFNEGVSDDYIEFCNSILESYFTIPSKDDKDGKTVFNATKMTSEEAEKFCTMLVQNGREDLIKAVLATITLENAENTEWLPKATEIFSVKYSNLIRDMYAGFINDGHDAKKVLELVEQSNCIPFDTIISKFGRNQNMIPLLIKALNSDSVIESENRAKLMNSAIMTQDGEIDAAKMEKYNVVTEDLVYLLAYGTNLNDNNDYKKQYNAVFEYLKFSDDVELWKMLYYKLDDSCKTQFNDKFVAKLKAKETPESDLTYAKQIYEAIGLSVDSLPKAGTKS